MNSIEYYLDVSQFNTLGFEALKEEFSSSELDILLKMCLVSESIDEIYQLYQSFTINLAILNNNYVLCFNDKIVNKHGVTGTDFHVINTLFNNIISSGRNLTERLQVFFDQENRVNSHEFKEQYYCKEYDNSFSYRFLNYSRNIVQHGHFILNMDVDGRYAFDFRKILARPHFKIKKSIQDEMLRYQQEFDRISESLNGKLSFTYTLSQYCISLMRIYVAYYSLSDEFLKNMISDVIDIMKKHPSMIVNGTENSEQEQVKLLLFPFPDDTVHGMACDLTYYEQFQSHKQEALKYLNFFENNSGDSCYNFPF